VAGDIFVVEVVPKHQNAGVSADAVLKSLYAD
jgi:hypothetical protein